MASHGRDGHLEAWGPPADEAWGSVRTHPWLHGPPGQTSTSPDGPHASPPPPPTLTPGLRPFGIHVQAADGGVQPEYEDVIDKQRAPHASVPGASSISMSDHHNVMSGASTMYAAPTSTTRCIHPCTRATHPTWWVTPTLFRDWYFYSNYSRRIFLFLFRLKIKPFSILPWVPSRPACFSWIFYSAIYLKRSAFLHYVCK